MVNNQYLDNHYSESKRPLTNYPKNFIKFIIDEFKINNKNILLDIGSGRGEFTNEFSLNLVETYAVDITERSLLLNKNIKYRKVNFNSDKLPFEDSKFDVIFHKSVIEHISNFEHFLLEQKRVLKNNGLMIFLTPNGPNQLKTFFDDPTHIKPYSLKGVDLLIKMYDFEKIKIENFFHHEFFFKNIYLNKLFNILCFFLDHRLGRFLTNITSIKFFRWSLEPQILVVCKNIKD